MTKIKAKSLYSGFDDVLKIPPTYLEILYARQKYCYKIFFIYRKGKYHFVKICV